MMIAPSEVAVASVVPNAGEEDQQRHDHDPAADAEQRAEEARHEANQRRVARALS